MVGPRTPHLRIDMKHVGFQRLIIGSWALILMAGCGDVNSRQPSPMSFLPDGAREVSCDSSAPDGGGDPQIYCFQIDRQVDLVQFAQAFFERFDDSTDFRALGGEHEYCGKELVEGSGLYPACAADFVLQGNPLGYALILAQPEYSSEHFEAAHELRTVPPFTIDVRIVYGSCDVETPIPLCESWGSTSG